MRDEYYREVEEIRRYDGKFWVIYGGGSGIEVDIEALKSDENNFVRLDKALKLLHKEIGSDFDIRCFPSMEL